MSSRDSGNRGNPQRPADDEQPTSKRSRFLDVDPADIDRYLSGREPRKPSGQSITRRSTSGDATGSGTARQLERLQQSVDQANKTRRSQSTEPNDVREADREEQRPIRRTPRSQTAYASESNLRSNRRRSYMEEDPYVSGYDDESEPASTPSYDVDSYDDDSEWDDEQAPAPVRRRNNRPSRPPMPRPSIQRPNIKRPKLPRSIASADIVNDASALGFIGLSTLGLATMAILVANRVDSLDPVIATHVSASGVLEHFANRETIWQLPLLATMLTLMNLVAAWFVSPLDRFASRFLLATGMIVQFVTWVALIRILW